MRYHFLDSSALVKLYIHERGTRRLESLLRLRDPEADPLSLGVVVSRLVFPETMSAITRRRNTGAIAIPKAKAIRSRLFTAFTSPMVPYEVVDASAVIVNRAALLVAQYGLRGFDAVQLATAIEVRLWMPPGEQLVFVSADTSLTRSARAEGLPTADPLGN